MHDWGLDTWAAYLTDLDVLLPSFLVGFVVAVAVSLADRRGQEVLSGTRQELEQARGRRD